MSADMIHAPFTDEQVAALNRWQERDDVHPFTCGGHTRSGKEIKLVATNKGWRCPNGNCHYTQDWAHDFMVQP